MLEIIAAAYESGEAFVKNGDVIFWVSPPYDKNGLLEIVGDIEVSIAINKYGFSAQSLSFPDLTAVYIHLNEEAKQAYIKRHGYWPTKRERDEVWKELRRLAPKEIIINWLFKIKQNELPKKGALELLEDLKANNVVTSDEKLRIEINELIAVLKKI